MGSQRRSRVKTQLLDDGKEGLSAKRTSALDENVQAIKRWERAILLARSKGEQLSDWIVCTAASGPVLILHVLWFAAWVGVNVGAIRGVTPFDPFPFPFLTMTVSLEAIFLALFVLASQHRLALQADKRSHLDLQIDLLAEREMTAVLQLLQDIARHLEVKTTITTEQLRDLVKKTDVHGLTSRMDELAERVTEPTLPGRRSTAGDNSGQEESGTSTRSKPRPRAAESARAD